LLRSKRRSVRLALVQLALMAAVVTMLGVHTLTEVRRDPSRHLLLADGIVALLAVAATANASLALRQSRAALRERLTELDAFAGRVAHELTSPLMGVAYGLGFLKARVADDSASAAAVNRATRSLERVRAIASGLRDYARAGAATSSSESTAIDEVLGEVVKDLQLEAAAAKVKLECALQSCSRVRCPPDVLTRIVENLVRNAISHMGDRSPRAVRVRARDTEGFVRVDVEDTGPGVPAEILSTVFDPFVRGSPASTGAGVGLSTVKKLAEAHGGRVGCRSRPNAGSVFWFELPHADKS